MSDRFLNYNGFDFYMYDDKESNHKTVFAVDEKGLLFSQNLAFHTLKEKTEEDLVRAVTDIKAKISALEA